MAGLPWTGWAIGLAVASTSFGNVASHSTCMAIGVAVWTIIGVVVGTITPSAWITGTWHGMVGLAGMESTGTLTVWSGMDGMDVVVVTWQWLVHGFCTFGG